MRIISFCLLLFSLQAWGQYEDYDSYQTFSDLDLYERDFGLIFMPSLMYLSIEEDNSVTGTSVSDRARNLTFYDIQLGYAFHNGFYFGMLYSGETQDINTTAPRTSRESIGMSFGWVNKGWAMTATFFPYSKQTLQSSGTVDVAEYTTGLGFQLAGAYHFRLNRYFSIGPQILYKSIRYGKGEIDATSINRDASSQHSVFTPMVSMIFNLYRG